MNPEIFRAYDIRGVYPNDLNEEDAWKIGQVTVRSLPLLVKGYDRGQPLVQALIKDIRGTDIGVIDIGMIDTLPMYFTANPPSVSVGIQVTTSHNPAMYNGFKTPDFLNKIAFSTEKWRSPITQGLFSSESGHRISRSTQNRGILALDGCCRICGRGYSYDDRWDKKHDSEKELAMAKKMNNMATTVGTESTRTTAGHRADAQTDGSYAQSWPALVDKYLSCPIRGVGWYTTMALFLLLLPPVLDNVGGRIEDGHSLLWSTVKGLVLASLFICVLVVHRVCGWVRRQMG